MKRLLTLAMAAVLTLTVACAPAPSSTAPSEPAPSSETAAPSDASSLVEGEQPECLLPTEQTALKVATLKGPSAIGMLSLMNQSHDPESAKKLANDYTFTIAGAPDQLVGGVISGEYDIAVLPTNLASTVYNKTNGQVSLATINTLGVLYLVETGDTIQSVADLKGKTIYATGKGSTPEYVLNYLLEKNGLVVGTDVTVEYKSEHSELTALMAAGQADIALLPQPFVTTALAQNDKLRVVLDLTKEWEAASKDGSTLAMSGIVVQKKLLEENPAAVDAFLAEYKASTDYATDPAQLDGIAELTVKYEIIPKAEVAKKAIPQCNITYLDGESMQKAAQGFLEALYAANPKSVGGNLPNEDFYYKR